MWFRVFVCEAEMIGEIVAPSKLNEGPTLLLTELRAVYRISCDDRIRRIPMSTQRQIRIARQAYHIAWAQFSWWPHLTSGRKHAGASRLRRYVKLATESGEGEEDPSKIATLALRRLSESEDAGSRAA
jgi:hypothetical protein